MAARSSTRAFTLVELMIAVAIIGVVAAVAIQSTRAYLAASKTAEARNMVGAIARAAVSAYERETSKSQSLKDGKRSKRAAHSLCGTAKRVPKKVPRARKYQPRTKNKKDFQTGTTTKGWKCLGFSIEQPISYRYSYIKGAKALVGKNNPAKPVDKNGFEAGAMGDLDGDGKVSRFALTGHVNPKTKRIKLATSIYLERESE
jgi:type IV pilus assembly protein PilA